MAFTHGHINAYVIVGGDSDFISLVEKLKQYDKQIFVVGGRAFTSLVMQRNCHEFIAYENLVGSRRFQPIAGSGQQRARVDDAAGVARSGGAAGAARAEGADRSRGDAAARPAQEHAAAARLDVLRAHLRRRQLPRLRAEAGRGRPRRRCAKRGATCSSSSPSEQRRSGAAAPQPPQQEGAARRRQESPRARRAATPRRPAAASAAPPTASARSAACSRRRRSRRAGRCTSVS